jgi:hypothetical protein
VEDMFKAAAEYAAKGWRTLPIYGLEADGKTCSCRNGYSCGTPGKHPVHRDWQNSATTDEDTLEEWFGDHEGGPLAAGVGVNIGVALGEASGIIDIEWDCEAGKATAEVFGLTGIDTPTYQSHRSEHRLFKYDGRLPQQAVVKFNGLEIRIGGGDKGAQSVFPPSLHASGVRYRWKYGYSPDDVDVAEVPESLMQAVLNKHGTGTREPVSAILHKGATSGDRHNSMVRIVAATLIKMLNPHDAQEQQDTLLMAKALNQSICEPPLSDREVESIWRGQLSWAIKVRASGGGPEHLQACFESHEKNGFSTDPESSGGSEVTSDAPFTLTGLEYRNGEWFPGQWRLKVVHGHPVSYTLIIPVFSGGETKTAEITLTAEQYRSASKVAQAVLEATHTIILDEVPEEWCEIWSGRGRRKDKPAVRGLKAKLMDVANSEQAAAEAMRFAKVAEWFLSSILTVPAPKDEDRDGEPEAGGRLSWVRNADGVWELWFNWSQVWEDVDRGRRKILEGDQADLKRRILAITGESDFPKSRHRCEGGVQKRYIRWTEKHIRALERLASGDPGPNLPMYIGNLTSVGSKVSGKVEKWHNESEVLDTKGLSVCQIPCQIPDEEDR